MNIIDTHVHSSFSFDGENTPREMAEQAARLGLTAMTFTEHIDVDDYRNTYYRQSTLIPVAAVEIPPLKEEYKGRINLGFGAEIGQYLRKPELAESLIKDLKLDFVIGSAHVVPGYKDCYYLDYHKTNPRELLRLYFGEILELAEKGNIDVIGHLTYPLRYITGRDGIVVNLSEYADIIRDICITAAKRGIGLEINTGGIRRQNYGKADPELEYVKMFREAGGEIITIGSDAHRTCDIAANFKEGAEIAKAAGFKRIAYFEKRKPIFIEL
ncbi:MAG: histidinol-phosphatase HisJ family protein [Oscillospiraceae bacterium]|nr:histidinol-phosphatase HisJ family protein [Oscillospiraceae bacterium]